MASQTSAWEARGRGRLVVEDVSLLWMGVDCDVVVRLCDGGSREMHVCCLIWSWVEGFVAISFSDVWIFPMNRE